jgi:hypothetical protein
MGKKEVFLERVKKVESILILKDQFKNRNKKNSSPRKNKGNL